MSNEKVTKISSQVMELKDLISAPLIATIDADSISSRRYLQYLYEIAFEEYNSKTGKVGKLRLLTFNYMSNESGDSAIRQVTIPLLTLVPLPLLQIKEADFDFDIQVVDAFEQEKESRFSLKDSKEIVSNNGSNSETGMKLRVSLASMVGDSEKTGVRQDLTANMRVKVKMQQADMPGGLSKLLGFTANNLLITQPYIVEKDKNINKK